MKKKQECEASGNNLEWIKFNNYSKTIGKEHIYLLMKYLKYAKVEFIMAPYEADAQLAYMHKCGQIDYVITEDSDLVLYGCENIINKLNQSGYCELLQVEKNKLMWRNSDTEEVEEFVSLTHDQKIWMSLIVGCDYINKVRGVGLKKGIALIENCKTIQDVFITLKEKCKRFDNSSEYKRNFQMCEYVFKYQMVYNKNTKNMCYFQEMEEKTKAIVKVNKNFGNFVGNPIKDIEQHVKGNHLEEMFGKDNTYSDEFFRSIENKVTFSNYKYSMNTISNLVCASAPFSNIKDDISVCHDRSTKFYNESKDVQDSSKENSLSKLPKEKFQNSQMEMKKQKRSRSSDYPATQASIASLIELKPRRMEKRIHEMSTRRKKSARIKAQKANEISSNEESSKNEGIEVNSNKESRASNNSTKVSLNTSKMVANRSRRRFAKHNPDSLNNRFSKPGYKKINKEMTNTRKSKIGSYLMKRKNKALQICPISLNEMISVVKLENNNLESVNISNRFPYRSHCIGADSQEIDYEGSYEESSESDIEPTRRITRSNKRKEIYNKDKSDKRKSNRSKSKMIKFSQDIYAPRYIKRIDSDTDMSPSISGINSDEDFNFPEEKHFLSKRESMRLKVREGRLADRKKNFPISKRVKTE